MKEPDLVYLAVIVAVLVFLVAIVVISTSNVIAQFVVTIFIASAIVYTVHRFLGKQYPIIGKATMFLFLREVLQPNLDQVSQGFRQAPT